MRYTGPKFRRVRRSGTNIYQRGAGFPTRKCGLDRKPYVPGKYGKDQNGKKTAYHDQLRRKQATKWMFGLTEKKFVAYYETAMRMPGNSGENFVRLLEMRFDNVVYRAGLAATRDQARQMVGHNHFRKDGVRSNIPSLQVKVGDVFSVKDASKTSPLFAAAAGRNSQYPSWLKVDMVNLTIEILRVPSIDEMERIDTQTIIEFYSR